MILVYVLAFPAPLRKDSAEPMSTEKSPISTSGRAPTRWVIVGMFVIAWLLAVILFYTDMVKVLAARPWWEDFIAALATVAVPILALLELLHSADANRLRDEANEERRKANRLTEQNDQLTAELSAERNRHLAADRYQHGSLIPRGSR